MQKIEFSAKFKILKFNYAHLVEYINLQDICIFPAKIRQVKFDSVLASFQISFSPDKSDCEFRGQNCVNSLCFVSTVSFFTCYNKGYGDASSLLQFLVSNKVKDRCAFYFVAIIFNRIRPFMNLIETI